MADNRTPPRQPLAPKRRVLLLITTLIVLCACGLLVYSAFQIPWKVVVDNFPEAATALTGAVGLWLTTRGRPDGDAASRERLREAEQQLEESLRGSVTLSTGQGKSVEAVRLEAEQSAPGGDRAEPDGPTDFLPPPPPVEVPALRALALADLWAVTHRRLDLYHDIATRQARQSFRNAQAAMVIGFLLLVGFVTVALKASTTTGAVVAGGLGAVSAALAGYVSRTFVKSQETAAGHLKPYFDQPLEFSRYLAAERLLTEAGLTEEQRQEAVVALVKTLAGPPGSAAPAGADEQKPKE
ncbi:hypothetical protein ACF1B0_25960 [Streptomyces anandii]|uniref:TRADD-N-associated membrane domain-containing protein n=1 Tax=Streptomyces anandii TaxID=285454 RepID=UPI0036FA614F